MKVLDSMWFTTIQGTFGFAVGENDKGERTLYAGAVLGSNKAADVQTIFDWGSKVNIPMLESLIAKTKKV